MSTPAISIIVPSYRHASYLRERMDSLLAQSHTDWEMLMIDDCSPDDSAAVLRDYAGDPRVTLRVHERNRGLNVTINEGLDWARGEYVHIAESDDTVADTLLERLAALLAGRPETGIAHAGLDVIDAEGKHLWPYRDRLPADVRAHLSRDYTSAGLDEFRRLVVGVNHIGNCSGVLFRRACYERFGGRDRRFRQTADWHMWMRYCLGWDVAYIAEPLVRWRRHKASVRREISRLEKEQNYYATMRDCLRRAPFSRAERRALWVKGRDSRRPYAGDVWAAARASGGRLRALRLALRYDPHLIGRFAAAARA